MSTDRASTSLLKQAKAAGLRVSKQREQVLDVLENSADLPDALELTRRAQKKDSAISTATVYRLLRALETNKLVEKITVDDGRARYRIAKGTAQDLIVDIETGRVMEIEEDGLDRLKHELASRLGFEEESLRVELYGRRATR